MQPIQFIEPGRSTTEGSPSANSRSRKSVLAGKRVIVVEDEGITQMHLRHILRGAGLLVVGSAITGPEGVKLVLQDTPDIVLMDIQMPGEYNGLEAAGRILAERNVCVVMLTAFNEESYRERARQIGVSGFVVKPVDRDILMPQLETAYNKWKPQ